MINQGKTIREFRQHKTVSHPEFATTPLIYYVIDAAKSKEKLNGIDTEMVYDMIYKILTAKNNIEIDDLCIDYSLSLIKKDFQNDTQKFPWSIKIFLLLLTHYKFLINYETFHEALENVKFKNFINKNSHIFKQVDGKISEKYDSTMSPQIIRR